MKRTILERVRCMLSNAGLSKEFWAKTVNTIVNLINRSSSSILDFDIPEEVWSGKQISYSHLRVFDYEAFAHVLKEQRTKLDVKF